MSEYINVDLVIVGGGPAGMSAAVAAYDAGLRNILILERDTSLGGILRQCKIMAFRTPSSCLPERSEPLKRQCHTCLSMARWQVLPSLI